MDFAASRDQHSAERRASRIAGLVSSGLLPSPHPVETQISIVLGLPDGGVVVAEQQLKARVAKLVIAAYIPHCRGLSVRWHGSLHLRAVDIFCRLSCGSSMASKLCTFGIRLIGQEKMPGNKTTKSDGKSRLQI